jgi:transposase
MTETIRKRWLVVNYWLEYGKPSLNSVARATNTHPSYVSKWIKVYLATGNVESLPRKVPGEALRREMAGRAVVLVQQDDSNSAERTALKLSAEFSQSVSASTVRRWLRAANMVYQAPRFCPFLTTLQQASRVAFATANLGRDWRAVMFTDSKYFYLHPPRKGNVLRVWTKKGERRIVPAVKKSQQVHVYAGVTAFGVTSLIFATGTTGRRSTYTNGRTQQPHSGVCQLEYQDVILPQLVEDGNRLFSQSTLHANSWVFQQDGARIHTARNSIELIQRLVPGGLLPNWPANSPDLSWIENIWAWMEKQLRRRPVCRNVEQLEGVLLEIWEDLQQKNAHILRNCANSMAKRMLEVIEAGGQHIGH